MPVLKEGVWSDQAAEPHEYVYICIYFPASPVALQHCSPRYCGSTFLNELPKERHLETTWGSGV